MIKIAIFASGTGSNFIALDQHIKENQIPVEIACLICDQPQAPVIEAAKARGIPIWTHRLSEFENKTAYEQSILAELKQYKVKLIVLAGYMKIVTKILLDAFPNSIMNIHPALLPAFPGRHGIEDAWAAGVEKTGVTVHLIDGGIDTGPIIAQQVVPILNTDNLEILANRIHKVEHQLYFDSLCQVLKQRNLI